MALTTLASHHTPTANYYQTTYFSIHTFKFIDAKGTEHLVKWRFIPRDGTKRDDRCGMKAAPHDFLEKNLIERTRKGPAGVGHDRLSSASPAIRKDNPTLAWAGDRASISPPVPSISPRRRRNRRVWPVNR